MALPRLNAPIFIAEARFGASEAASITRICSGGTIAKLAMPQIRIATAAVTGHCMSTVKASSVSAMIVSMVISVRSTDRSASRPPKPLPIVAPTPNSISIAVT